MTFVLVRLSKDKYLCILIGICLELTYADYDEVVMLLLSRRSTKVYQLLFCKKKAEKSGLKGAQKRLYGLCFGLYVNVQ